MRQALAYAQILAGSILSALAINLFLVPTQVPSGGLGGLMMILHYLWSIPIGPFYFLANIPSILWLWRLLGLKGLLKTLFGIGAFSLVLTVTAPLSAYAPTDNHLLAALFGGAMLGLGVGLTLTVGGDTGGNSSYARIAHHYLGVNVPRLIMLIDVLILAFAAVMLSVEAVLYGLVMTVVSGYCAQMVQDGLNSSRCFLIITEQTEVVGNMLTQEVVRGVTRLEGMGHYTGRPRPVLMCVVSKREVHRVKRRVLATDPEAFIMITDAREVSGRGFTLDHELRPAPYWAAQY